ncbi:thiol reductant ABC exporter subunit CydC [Motiliproteus sp. MSK22-1]|uniref:thiol reductant ABC exporter subunit CydC n=1 Tax=Motiliproteus sp. MSK22-1 TaxID=1897630 RepID=UPI0009786046|nr:thiol reductant ABC exporter subunit CydC [Motiliproteus sp. MSK22-1]OMH38866.1 thiol reductant ABC exporter subunit CydC [Motiliproteus sp. MSK22-1]
MKDLLRLLALSRSRWLWMSLGILLALVTVIANISLLSISGWFLASMAVAGIAGISMNYFTPAAIIRFLAILRTAGRYGERLVTHDATLRLLSDLRVWFYRRLEPLAPAQLQNYHSGDLLSRIQADIDTLDNFYLRLLLPSVVALIGIPLVVIIIALYDHTIAGLTLAALLLVGVAIPLQLANRTRKKGKQLITESAALRTALIDGVQGMRELIIYDATERHSDHCLSLSQSYTDLQRQINRASSSSQALTLLVINICVWISLWLLIPQVASTARPPVELAMLILLVMASFETVLQMPLAFEQLSTTLTAARRLFSIIDTKPRRKEPGKSSPALQRCDLHLDNISFDYRDNDYPDNDPQTCTPNKNGVLNRFNLTIGQGEKIAILGPSGAGKTSITHLLLGFWQPQQGSISIGGYNIDDFYSEDLRRHFSVVSQHSYLFANTIRHNLLLGNPQADQAMLDHACRVAGLDTFISTLPDGYDTWLGETGRGLSGGQSRRIAIAQAIIKQAPVLILDEPTEGLDPITEAKVTEALLEAMKERTVILITHRLTMLEAMDNIAIIENGSVVEIGNHQQLNKTSKRYQNLLSYF